MIKKYIMMGVGAILASLVLTGCILKNEYAKLQKIIFKSNSIDNGVLIWR